MKKTRSLDSEGGDDIFPHGNQITSCTCFTVSQKLQNRVMGLMQIMKNIPNSKSNLSLSLSLWKQKEMIELQ